MNKKNLSVVLAGAMLATSVAPVLADTTTAKEYSLDNIKLLEKEILNTMKSEMLTTNKALIGDGTKATAFLEEAFAKLLVDNVAGENLSAYGVRVLDAQGNKVDLHDIDDSTFTTADTFVTYNVKSVEALFNNTNVKKLKAGYSLELVRRETTEFKGQLIPGTQISKGASKGKYEAKVDFVGGLTTTKSEIAGTNDESVFVKKANITASTDNSTLTVLTNKLSDNGDATTKEEFYLTDGMEKIDGTLPLDEKGNLLDYTNPKDIEKFKNFETLSSWTKSTPFASEPALKETFKLVNTEENENIIKASDLYDGIALTAKGTELSSDLTNAAEAVGSKVADVTNSINAAGKGNDEDKALVKLSNETFTTSTVYNFEINYYKNATDAAHSNGTGQNPYKTITVHSTDKNEISALYNLLKSGSFNVGIVGGANRYATAVNVAKAYSANLKIDDQADPANDIFNNNIVIVNGDSLVDGLAAAPLAASLNKVGANKTSDLKAAPVLLSKTDSLPTETKEYIEYLASGIAKKDRRAYTINLVGGKSVLSDKVVAELEDMGFTVKRFGGDNRESTSLKVAEALKVAGNTDNDAFIVGGNGEADAMAISAVAASTKTPIIVSSVHGISSKALTYINENSAKGDITIVGGTSVVSEAEESDINDVLSLNKVSRVAGDNRFETNAKIIETYYGDKAAAGSEGVILVKDGVAKKSELVDALAAANYAVTSKAPIVLASKSLNDVQKDVLVNKFKVGTMNKVVQVGQGAERSVLETVAKLFNVKNN